MQLLQFNRSSCLELFPFFYYWTAVHFYASKSWFISTISSTTSHFHYCPLLQRPIQRCWFRFRRRFFHSSTPLGSPEVLISAFSALLTIKVLRSSDQKEKPKRVFSFTVNKNSSYLTTKQLNHKGSRRCASIPLHSQQKSTTTFSKYFGRTSPFASQLTKIKPPVCFLFSR